MQQFIEQAKLFDWKAATGTTVAYPIRDAMHIFLSLFTSGSANFTLNVKISHQTDAPTFGAAASPTNQWSYAQVKLSTNNTGIDGSVSMITTAGTDLANIYTVNTDGAAWIGSTITAYAAGAITLWLTAKNNQ